MTIKEFREWILCQAMKKNTLTKYAKYIRHSTRDDKRLREEYLPILAVLDSLKLSDSQSIEVGEDRKAWDARVDGSIYFEVVQALPDSEHESRTEISTGSASLKTWLKHAKDNLQFPQKIIDAIDVKHSKKYPKNTILVVCVDGDYTMNCDQVIGRWLRVIQRSTKVGKFSKILLVERDRRKVFEIF